MRWRMVNALTNKSEQAIWFFLRILTTLQFDNKMYLKKKTFFCLRPYVCVCEIARIDDALALKHLLTDHKFVNWINHVWVRWKGTDSEKAQNERKRNEYVRIIVRYRSAGYHALCECILINSSWWWTANKNGTPRNDMIMRRRARTFINNLQCSVWVSAWDSIIIVQSAEFIRCQFRIQWARVRTHDQRVQP